MVYLSRLHGGTEGGQQLVDGVGQHMDLQTHSVTMVMPHMDREAHNITTQGTPSSSIWGYSWPIHSFN